MKKSFILVAALAVLASCNGGKKFDIEGTISGAEGKTIYLEKTGISQISVMDSAKVSKGGKYSLKAPMTDAPEYYRLRIGGEVINIIENGEQKITIDAPLKDFSTKYTTSSELNNKVKNVSLKQIELQTKIASLHKQMVNSEILPGIYNDSINNMMTRYKKLMRDEVIYPNLQSPLAYFALYQRIGGGFIFNPQQLKEDLKCFQAVATTMKAQYPEAERTKNIYSFTLKILKDNKIIQEQINSLQPKQIEVQNVSETGLIDIKLYDVKGNLRSLSDLKGKNILLDFTAYAASTSSEHNFFLRKLSEKHKDLEIYQVSLDDNEHFWRTVADKLPWICVNDPSGVYSTIARTYNVTELPSMFFIDKSSVLQKRFKDENDVKKFFAKR